MGEKIIVQLASPERYYSKCYHDFMDCNLLSGEEKIIFLALKRFLDVKSDNGNVYPTIETIQKMTSWGNQKVVKYIKSLVKKGVVKKIRQGLNKPNVYTLADYPTMWACDNVEDMETVANNKGVKPLTPAEHIAELERMGYTVQIKEKELASTAPTKVTAETSTKQSNKTDVNNDTINSEKNQDLERYTLDQIKQLFSYDIMLQDHPSQQQDIDSVMAILHKTMNTTKPTVRIAGQAKPSMTVIGKLMKLDKELIMYAIKKFSEQTERIKNPAAYMLTILFNVQEQFYLDEKNRTSNENAKANGLQDAADKKSTNGFANFEQRSYNYDALEANLLNELHKTETGQENHEDFEGMLKRLNNSR